MSSSTTSMRSRSGRSVLVRDHAESLSEGHADPRTIVASGLPGRAAAVFVCARPSPQNHSPARRSRPDRALCWVYGQPYHADAVAWAARAPYVADDWFRHAPGCTVPATPGACTCTRSGCSSSSAGSPSDAELVLHAALWHDIGREGDGVEPEHGRRSAERADELGLTAKLPSADAAVVRFAILRHSLPDSGAAPLAAELAASEDEAPPGGSRARPPRPQAAQGRGRPGPRPSRLRRVRRSPPAAPPGDHPAHPVRERAVRRTDLTEAGWPDLATPATSTLVTLVAAAPAASVVRPCAAQPTPGPPSQTRPRPARRGSSSSGWRRARSWPGWRRRPRRARASPPGAPGPKTRVSRVVPCFATSPRPVSGTGRGRARSSRRRPRRSSCASSTPWSRAACRSVWASRSAWRSSSRAASPSANPGSSISRTSAAC